MKIQRGGVGWLGSSGNCSEGGGQERNLECSFEVVLLLSIGSQV